MTELLDLAAIREQVDNAALVLAVNSPEPLSYDELRLLVALADHTPALLDEIDRLHTELQQQGEAYDCLKADVRIAQMYQARAEEENARLTAIIENVRRCVNCRRTIIVERATTFGESQE